MFFFILITCLVDMVLILKGEIMFQSPMRVKESRLVMLLGPVLYGADNTMQWMNFYPADNS